MQPANTLGDLLTQPILNADTYKATHWTFEHPDFENSYGYIEARRGGEFSYVQFLGLQYALRYFLMQQVTLAMIDEAEVELTAHGIPFNRTAWERVVDVHNGYIPVRVRALPEGVVVGQGCVLVTVESTDPELAGMAAYVETMLLRAVHYPTTIATRSLRWWKMMNHYYTETGEAPADFALVDFGARGAHSTEAAALGGMAHLVNFQVTDNLMGIRFAKHAYPTDSMPGFSIPATEHSVTTSWGRDNEKAFFERILAIHGDKAMPDGSRFPVSVVIDTYDQDEAIKMWLSPESEGGLLDRLKQSNMRVVLRPDSGDPIVNVIHVLELAGKLVGTQTNDKGYRVLPDYVRVIQGDGINEDSLRRIMARAAYHTWSMDNLVFGSGGGLLVHQAERDTHRFAMKTSEVTIAGSTMAVQKTVATDPSKASKAGRFKVVQPEPGGTLLTYSDNTGLGIDPWEGQADWLNLVYENGQLHNQQSWEEVRLRSAEFRDKFEGK
jgi:nicotinamide phosphoribosyltransferase